MSSEELDGIGRVAFGVLVVALCGSCTLHFQTTNNSYDRAWAGVALVVGGIPTLFGAWVIFTGVRKWRRASKSGKGDEPHE
jgi:hypothetical protein